jgi:hypothetical protein
MVPRWKFHSEDINSNWCDTNSDKYAEHTESDKDEDNDEEPSPPMQQQQIMRWEL